MQDRMGKDMARLAADPSSLLAVLGAIVFLGAVWTWLTRGWKKEVS